MDVLWRSSWSFTQSMRWKGFECSWKAYYMQLIVSRIADDHWWWIEFRLSAIVRLNLILFLQTTYSHAHTSWLSAKWLFWSLVLLQLAHLFFVLFDFSALLASWPLSVDTTIVLVYKSTMHHALSHNYLRFWYYMYLLWQSWSSTLAVRSSNIIINTIFSIIIF